jgi:hypothetical protein
MMKTRDNRSCNRCNRVRPGHVGYCPWCGCPEFSITDQAVTAGLVEAIAARSPQLLSTGREQLAAAAATDETG